MKNKEGIAYSKILGIYWNAMKKYPLSGIGLYVFYATGFLLMDILLPTFYRDLIDLISTGQPSNEIWEMILTVLIYIIVTHVAYNIIFRAADFMIVYHQSNVMRELENQAFENLQKRSYRFFTNSFAGGLVAKVKRFYGSFEKAQDEFTFQVWVSFVVIVGVFSALMITLRPVAIFFLTWAIFYIAANAFFIWFRRPYDLREASEDSSVTSKLADNITNVINIKLFTASAQEKKKFHQATQIRHQARSKSWNLNNIYLTVMSLFLAVMEIGGIWMTLKLWFNGSVSAGTVVLAQLYFLSVSTRTWRMGRAVTSIFKSFSNASEMVEILRQPLEVNDIAQPEKSKIKEGKIEFKNIHFNYENGENVFSDFNLTLPAGQKVGLVGHSGAGKSSLFRLLLRFMDLQKGQILIDGQDISQITQDDLRRAISFVPQDPILFHRSLLENIAYSDSNARKEDVIQAAKWAHAHEFIEKLPQKYQTLVGERGIKLSGGERQRIAIARAFLKKAPILLLDEATSSLDSVSEKYIQENLKKLMKGKTTLAIAHRISTIQQMDRILVMQDGKMVEDGTHETLLKKKGVYSTLWSHQSNGFLVEEKGS